METIRIQNGQSEQIELLLTDYDNTPISGATINVKIRRISDDYFYDWDDSTFKNSGWTTIAQAMTEVDSTNDIGKYKMTFDTSGFDDDTYEVRADYNSGGVEKHFIGELKVGDYIDNILSKDNIRRTFYISSTGVPARNVGVGKYDKELVEIKAEADADWSAPIKSFYLYYWYDNDTDDNPKRISPEAS